MSNCVGFIAISVDLMNYIVVKIIIKKKHTLKIWCDVILTNRFALKVWEVGEDLIIVIRVYEDKPTAILHIGHCRYTYKVYIYMLLCSISWYDSLDVQTTYNTNLMVDFYNSHWYNVFHPDENHGGGLLFKCLI